MYQLISPLFSSLTLTATSVIPETS